MIAKSNEINISIHALHSGHQSLVFNLGPVDLALAIPRDRLSPEEKWTETYVLAGYSVRDFTWIKPDPQEGWRCSVFRGGARRLDIKGIVCQAPGRPERGRELERLLTSIKFD